jgi:hypothetical protein
MEPRNSDVGDADEVMGLEGNIGQARQRERLVSPPAVRDLMHARRDLHAREPGDPLAARTGWWHGPCREGESRSRR